MLGVVAASVAVLGTGAVAAAGGPPPATLVDFPGVARSFDADAGRVAWIDSAWALHVRSLRSGVETKVLYTNPYEEIPMSRSGPRLVLEYSATRLVLEPRRLAWISTRGAGMFYYAEHVYVAPVGATHGHRVANVLHGDGTDGGYIMGLAGDAAGFAYGVAMVKPIGPDQQFFQVSGGGVFTLTGATPRKLPGAPPAIVLAETAGRLAIAPLDTNQSTDGTPLATGSIEIRNAMTGALVSSVTPAGVLRAATLTPTTLAVLAGSRIVRYDIASGQLLGSTPVPTNTAADLESSGTRIAFRRTRSVAVLDATTGRISTVVATPWRPTSVALDGPKLTWAERLRIAPGDVFDQSKKDFTTRVKTITLHVS
jgi:hypothetical protein